MVDYTLTLTAGEDLLLAHWLERHNAQRATEREEDGTPLPAVDATALLHFAVRNDLRNRMQELQTNTEELAMLLGQVGAAARTAVLAQLPENARKRWLQARLTPG